MFFPLKSIHTSIRMSAYMSMHEPGHMSIHVPIHMSIHMSAHMSVHYTYAHTLLSCIAGLWLDQHASCECRYAHSHALARTIGHASA